MVRCNHSTSYLYRNRMHLETFSGNFMTRTFVCMLWLKLRHNWTNSIAGSPCGDPGLESCKNLAAIRRFGTHPGLIRRRPVGHRPIIERRSGGHRPKCSGKNPQVIERRSGNCRAMTARCHRGHRTEIRRCL